MLETNEECIEQFKKRIEDDGYEFCFSLYEHSLVRLLAAKYAYYVCSNPFIEDITYDGEEKGWYIMGRALGILAEDETSPCVDWDASNPYAGRAIELANRLMRKR